MQRFPNPPSARDLGPFFTHFYSYQAAAYGQEGQSSLALLLDMLLLGANFFALQLQL